MHLTAYQIVAPVVSLLAILYAWNLVVRKKKTVWEACFWTLFWGTIAFITLYPSFLHYLSLLTGIANQENAVIVTFMGILFFLVFYLVVRLEELEQRHTKVVREIALREAGLEKNMKN
ncbi:DUF2304 domain-containing protein [Candidatus Peregrinibacteria bacterium]|nr:DUF2304 domain-containing protein [Candidatus Peregrinibacteria bacterium]